MPAETWQERNARLRAAYAYAENQGMQDSPPPANLAEFFTRETNRGSEAGSEDRWVLRPEYQEEYVGDDDPRVRAWLAQNRGGRNFLDENGKPIEIDDGDGRYVITANYRYGDLAQDPNYIGQLPDGRYVFDRQNNQSWEMDDRQRAEETSRRRGLQSYARMVAMMVAPVAAAYAFPATAAGMAGGMEATMAAAPGQGFATALGTAEGASAVGAATAGAAAPDFSNVTSGSSTTAGGVPVTDLGVPATSGVPVTDLSVPANTGSSGILRPVMDAGNQVAGWYNSLGPAGRLLVSSAVSGGVQALSSASAQRAAQQAADEREERTRQDRIRRGAVPAVVNPYTPRPAGIIGSAFTPRPGGG